MRLPSTLEKIKQMNIWMPMLRLAIRERRDVIRYHRDQKMDDRCWLDDFPVWHMLEYSLPGPTKLALSLDEMMDECRRFYDYRRADAPDQKPEAVVRDKTLWDYDLGLMDRSGLVKELFKIQNAIRLHYDILGRPRTLEDDRVLYLVLPEKDVADFRLPKRDDFLGDGKAPHAGCPSFWRSHQSCKGQCSLSKWGPCVVSARHEE